MTLVFHHSTLSWVTVALFVLYLLMCFLQGWARGSFVEAEAEVEAEARQSEIENRNRCCLCHFDIMHNAHVVVTCSCFVVNDIYQWKTLQRSFIKKYIKYQTKPRPRQKLWGRAEAGVVRSIPRQDRVRPRPSQLTKLPRAEADASRTTSLF